MRFLGISIIGIIILGCNSKNKTITFINKSKFDIDSITISVISANSYTKKHINIKKLDTVITSIPNNSPKSNKHDITVRILINIKEHNLIDRYYYNDLTGTLVGDYTIIFTEENDVSWKIDYKGY